VNPRTLAVQIGVVGLVLAIVIVGVVLMFAVPFESASLAAKRYRVAR